MEVIYYMYCTLQFTLKQLAVLNKQKHRLRFWVTFDRMIDATFTTNDFKLLKPFWQAEKQLLEMPEICIRCRRTEFIQPYLLDMASSHSHVEYFIW